MSLNFSRFVNLINAADTDNEVHNLFLLWGPWSALQMVHLQNCCQSSVSHWAAMTKIVYWKKLDEDEEKDDEEAHMSSIPQGRFLIVLQLKTLPLPGGLHLLKNDDTILMGKTNEHPGKNSWLINLCLLFTLQQSKPEIPTWTTESDVQGFRV